MARETANEDRLLTRREVEQRFGITKRYLELAIGRGEGPAIVRVGRRSIRYRINDVRAWIDENRTNFKSGGLI